MANFVDYGQIGVGSSLEFGKNGGVLSYSNGEFSLLDSSSNIARLQVSTPQSSLDAANKAYVDSVIQGLDIKEAVNFASHNENKNLSGTFPFYIDGQVATNGQRVLLKDQTDPTQNGIYTVVLNGTNYTLQRTSDASGTNLEAGSFVFVENGATNASTGWAISSPSGKVDVGTDHIVWTQFSSAGVPSAGTGIVQNGNVFSANVDGSTITVNNNGQLTIESTGAAGTVLTSNGNGGVQWGGIDLSSTSKNILPGTILSAANGGTGHSSYNSGDILLGNSNSGLSTLAQGAVGTYLTVTPTGIEWAPLNVSPSSLNNGSNYFNVDSTVQYNEGSYTNIAGQTSATSVGNNAGGGVDVQTGYFGTSQTTRIKATNSNNATQSLVLDAENGGMIFGYNGYSSTLANMGASAPQDAIPTVGWTQKFVNSVKPTSGSFGLKNAATSGNVVIGTCPTNTISEIIVTVGTPVTQMSSNGSSSNVTAPTLSITAGTATLTSSTDVNLSRAGTYIIRQPIGQTDYTNQQVVATYGAQGVSGVTGMNGSVSILVRYETLS